MAQPSEPSMEEILSSIKRIIAEDGEQPGARRARPVAFPPADEEPDVLELTEPVGEPETMQAAEPEPESEREPEPEPISAEEAPALATAPVAPPPQPVRSARTEAETLVSSASADASRQALAALSRILVKPENPMADNTLEGLVREMLRPMLKDWLDAHLPRIVQETVDREVARISGRN